MTAAPWVGTEDLPAGVPQLLEASAGTGKTWQIAGLVVRLVAEYAIPLDRVLVITFTSAATAELRDRIRRRLLASRELLRGDREAGDDPILDTLAADDRVRPERLARVEAALSAFDLAPISTIHGFCQRMLEQLAFESGQEPTLELLTDLGPLLDELVWDELALAFASTRAEDLPLLEDLGWTSERLGAIARAMAAAVPPRAEPDAAPDGMAVSEPSGFIEQWRQRTSALLAWWEDPAGGLECREHLRLAFEQVNPSTGSKCIHGNKLRKSVVGGSFAEMAAWLVDGGPRGKRLGTTWAKQFGVGSVEDAWRGPGSVEEQAFYPLFARATAIFAEQDALWGVPAAGFARRVRRGLAERLRQSSLITYDTMLSRLATRISEEGPEGPLARAIRERFAVALVDEFQDTDSAQWSILRAVFEHPERRLLLIGDPKQAIYAFRGADLHVYLEAVRAVEARGQRGTMRTNWRSDKPYVEALNHCWGHRASVFGADLDVDYEDVEAAPSHVQWRLRGLPPGDLSVRDRRPLELRWVDGESAGQDAAREGFALSNKAQAEEWVATLAAAETARLLGSEAEIYASRDGEQPPDWRRLDASDIALLVGTNDHGKRIERHLRRWGIPTVSTGRVRVFDSSVASWVLAWLDAVAAPGRDRPARSLAATALFGWSAAALAASMSGSLADPRWNRWMEAIAGWAERWPRQGFARVFEAALDSFDVLPRLLCTVRGERLATDLRHLLELVHREERRARMSPAALAAWLRGQQGRTAMGGDDPSALRIESDASAVRIVTVHKSKGLEYPIVLVPFLWVSSASRDGSKPVRWHAERDGKERLLLDLHPKQSPLRALALAGAEREARQERMRQAYVALTRAAHHCVLWLGPLGQGGQDLGASPVGSLVLRQRDEAGQLVPSSPIDLEIPSCRAGLTPAKLQGKLDQGVAAREEAWRRLDRLAESSQERLGWSRERRPEPAKRLRLGVGAPLRVEAQPWTGRSFLGGPWQVLSYTSLMKGVAHPSEEPLRREELHPAGAHSSGESGQALGSLVPIEAADPTSSSSGYGVPSEAGELSEPIQATSLTGGAAAGTWVHAILEELDFQSGQARDRRPVLELARDLGLRHGIRRPEDHELVTGLLARVLETPLDGGPTALPVGYTLSSLQPADRIDELPFDLRLGLGSRWSPGSASGSGPSGSIDAASARRALVRGLDRPGWKNRPWLERILANPQPIFPAIPGLLTGFVDLVFRVPAEGSPTGRVYLADYKTNRIGPPHNRRDSRRLHYGQGWLAREMDDHGYPLQSLIYTVALHRLLRLRDPDYCYERDMGGSLYLFVRGMEGARVFRDEGLALGVYADRWPAQVVVGLDRALDGHPVAEVESAMDAVATGGAVR